MKKTLPILALAIFFASTSSEVYSQNYDAGYIPEEVKVPEFEVPNKAVDAEFKNPFEDIKSSKEVSNPPEDEVSKAFREFAESPATPNSSVAPTYFDYDKTNTDRSIKSSSKINIIPVLIVLALTVWIFIKFSKKTEIKSTYKGKSEIQVNPYKGIRYDEPLVKKPNPASNLENPHYIATVSVINDIVRLKKLLDEGAITSSEFDSLKSKIVS